MEEPRVIKLISQYLHERGFVETLRSLERESGRHYNFETMAAKTGELQEILDEYEDRKRAEEEAAVCISDLFQPGDGSYVNVLWTSLDYLTEGYNVLVVRLIETGALALGGSKAMLVTTEIPIPLSLDSPPQSVISQTHILCKGAVLCMDFHPIKRNLLLCGSMDRCCFIMDLDQPESPLVQMFSDHSKYVVRCLWSTSGEYFMTGSYDKTVCIYRLISGSLLYEKIKQIEYKGAIEAAAMSKKSDVFVVGVRNDHLLHCVEFSSEEPKEVRQINMNAFGDDYVSFTALHVTFSPDERYLLVSTDRDRLILYSWEHGKLIANLYGATNDEYSQPRHCWDPSGQYIYGTSQDKSICVWEIRSQRIVTRLEAHSGIVRDLYFCQELNLLVSCGFDGAVKLWRNNKDVSM